MNTDASVPDSWSARQRAVWAGEETYWDVTAEGDVEGFMALVHEDFVGWPDTEETAITLENLRPVIEEWVADDPDEDFRYELTPLGVALSGDTGVAYYRATEHRGGADNTYRITHTWLETDEEWKILGGLSAPAEQW